MELCTLATIISACRDISASAALSVYNEVQDGQTYKTHTLDPVLYCTTKVSVTMKLII